jgi:hypothetical protein
MIVPFAFLILGAVINKPPHGTIRFEPQKAGTATSSCLRLSDN